MPEVLTFVVTDAGLGRDRATCVIDGETFTCTTTRGAVAKLARQIIGAVHLPDGPWRAVGQDGRIRFYGPSVHGIAATIVQHEPRLRIVRWKPKPSFATGEAVPEPCPEMVE